eukprot:Blabericola_migrator_1__4309@NODE_2321_length_2942_cov_19_348174_g1455_i0_p1_GENE_NODE_2321_length_2942_cov_19_348174_g1455_i0NODE_2321_length_2942_cov_19_348174_g1455_i0_p1_ORF_typecomplete_len238_score25_56_NODE_2321_length_2942_cov_19_348174_g1455_i08261539
MIEFHERKGYDKALSVMDQEFHESKHFHKDFFGLLRSAMRSYGSTKLLSGSKNPGLCDLHGTPLEELVQRYAEGLQSWCTCVHQLLIDKVDTAIDAACLFDTEESSNFITALEVLGPTYTRNVNWLMEQIDLSQMGIIPAPPETSMEVSPQLEELREGIHTLGWLMRNMPWDCFLSFRSSLASLVRELDGEKQGFSFLANILETLSFTDGDIDEFRQYYTEAKRLDRLRWLKSRSAK